MYKINKLKKEDWPAGLFEIPQPPTQLYIRGDLPPKENIHLAIVGTRRCSSYGKDVCEKLIAGLKGYPITIVSGLATGIDTFAHKYAMQNNLPTIAVPGSGLDEIALFPKPNIPLAREIEKHGCLLSEFEPEFKATQYSFPQRNRIVAGMCKAVLVVEAPEKSGALITARMAVDYNRDVLAVPGQIFAPNASGTNRLIRQGATPITCAQDLLEALGFDLPDDEMKQEKLFADCSPEENKILEILLEPTPRDELIRALGRPITETNMLLSAMEIKGMIKEEMGEIRRG